MTMPGSLSIRPTRRALIAGAGAALAMPAIWRARADELPALRDLGALKGIEVGSAFSLDPDPKYRAVIARHCAVITPEWQMKPPQIKPDAASPYDFSVVDQFFDFAGQHGQQVHGHTLYWSYVPIDWAVGATFEETKELYGGFIRTVAGRYPQVRTWDVLNELIDDETFGLRTGYLVGQYGYDFIDFCLRTAREAAPQAKLAINDYWIECAAQVCEGKRGSVIDMFRKLKEMGSPLDAMGIQSHLYSRMPVDPDATFDLINEAAGLGLESWISELDVNDSTLPADIAERDALVADIYARYLAGTLRHPAVKRVIFWGISDYYNWVLYDKEHWDQRPPETGDARPALFDTANEPKAAFHAVARVLAEAPAR
jgi:endo-1,4-beta-xylanase